MIFLVNLPQFLLRHVPIFLAGIFLGLLSAASSINAAANIFFPKVSYAYPFFIGVALAVVICISSAMVIYGRPQWVWVMVGVFVFCLLMQLSPAAYRLNPYLWFVDVLFPLLGLLVLNSKRHRRMRRKMVQVRRFRVMVRKAMALVQERERGRS